MITQSIAYALEFIGTLADHAERVGLVPDIALHMGLPAGHQVSVMFPAYLLWLVGPDIVGLAAAADWHYLRTARTGNYVALYFAPLPELDELMS